MFFYNIVLTLYVNQKGGFGDLVDAVNLIMSMFFFSYTFFNYLEKFE